MPQDVFLSYSWIDNTGTEQLDRETKEPLGWVAYLAQQLASLVSMRRGVRTHVWRDATDMPGNFHLSQDVYAALDVSRLFVAVLSEGYLRSDWCPDEYERFRLRASREPHPTNWKRRIFHLFRTPLGGGFITPEMADAKQYRFFFRRSEADADYTAYEPNPTGDFKAHFDRVVTDLADDLARELSPQNNAVPRGTVYLASPSADLQVRYVGLRAELKDKGYTILPDVALPAEGFADAVRQQLARSDCCIFPIGKETLPSGDGADRCEAEFRLALAACDPVARPLLVWLPPSSEVAGRPFVGELAEGKIAGPGLTLRRSEYRSFKADLFQWIEALRQQQAVPPVPRGLVAAPARGTLIHDFYDASLPVLGQLQSLLASRVLPYAGSDFAGDSAALRQAECLRLQEAPFVLIFCGAGSKEWLAAKLSAVKANPGPVGRKLGVLLIDDGREFKRTAARSLGEAALLCPADGALDAAAAARWLDHVLDPAGETDAEVFHRWLRATRRSAVATGQSP